MKDRKFRAVSNPQIRGRAISLFSGAGGLDLGLHNAGWKVLAQIEIDKDCVETLRRHSGQLGIRPRLLASPVENVDPLALRRLLRLRRGELDLLAGGPPCQPFTTTGLRQAITDRRAATAFPSYLSFVSEFLPRALVIENVDG
ncbi:MAG: DNA cytosine methyltransferase, partial [Steroidobacteraceae bacterium]